jgi:hypothetical protein
MVNRRTFMGTLPLSTASFARKLSLANDYPVASNALPAAPTAPLLPPGVKYFTQERLQQLVKTDFSLSGIRFHTVAYNFPNYHPSPAQERYFGKDWTEWEVLARAKPVFPGHLMPKYPLWGYYNEADPKWAEWEIETLSAHGVNTIMVDWYWYNGVQILQEQLEQGFLKAPNRHKMSFAVMWANLDWNNQYPAPNSAEGDYGRCAVLYKQTYSSADMDRIIDYWLEHYLREPNYWKIDGQPVIGIFDPTHLLKIYSPAEVRKVFDRMRNRAVQAGLKGLHFQASHVYAAGKTPLKESGYDSATRYHTFAGGPPGKTSEFATGVERSIERWKDDHEKVGVLYFPDCPVGWDNSSRYGKGAHIYIHRTPDQYELFLRAAKYFVAEHKTDPPIVFLSSWNEWTEDHVFAPDVFYGYGYLEAIRREFLYTAS